MIRLKHLRDFEVLAHELGHHLEEHIGGKVKALKAAHRGEYYDHFVSARH